MKLVVSGYNWARRHKREFDAVITCEDPDTYNGLRFWKEPHPDHLVLRFVDLDSPAPQPHTDELRFRLASREQIEQAIEFGRNRDSLLVHCQVGVGRSTAVALAILADQHGAGAEQRALEALLAVRPQSVPNLCVVGLADDILGCGGKLIETVTDWDKTLEENRIRRVANRTAHFRYYGLDLE